MLKIEIDSCDFGPVVQISDDVNTFEILFTGNGDLYFEPIIYDYEIIEKDIPIYFNINKEDGFLFESFKQLYSQICNYETVGDCNQLKKDDSSRKYPLVNKGIISWHSDADMSEISSVLNIKKLDEDNLQLEFIKNQPQDEMDLTYSVRFRNSGSAYEPFNLTFMKLYNDLCSYYTSEKDDKTVPVFHKTYK